MRMFAKDGACVVTGTITEDAEYKTVGDKRTPLVRLNIKTDSYKSDEGKWLSKWDNVLCWRAMAEQAKGFKKDDVVLATGKAEVKEYNGKNRTEITCDFIVLMHSVVTVAPYVPPISDESGLDIDPLGDDSLVDILAADLPSDDR